MRRPVLIAIFWLLTAAPLWGAEGRLRVLLVGNSFVERNDLAGVLTALAAPGEGQARLHVESVTRDGYTLEAHWKEPETRRRIREGNWDYVVLQEQSRRPLTDPVQMFEFARRLHEEIGAAGARTLLLMTWARRDEPEEAAVIAEAYETIAERLGLAVVPVGRVWDRTLQRRPGLALYAADGVHPSPVGTYLAACVLLQAIADDPDAVIPVEVTGVTREEGLLIQRVVLESLPRARGANP